MVFISIMHVCLSISAQVYCKIKLLYFWVHLNTILTCVIITNLSWPPMFQDIITNPYSGRIVLFSNFPRPDFIIPIKESWRYMPLPLIPCEWIWNYVYLIWPCPGFSIVFRMKHTFLRWNLFTHIFCNSNPRVCVT